jgi:hypothetical protein
LAVAKEFRLSTQVVNILCRAVKQNPDLLAELVDKRDGVANRRAMIASSVMELNKCDIIIDNAA